jgi:antitoxin ParD1/3/4
MPTRNVNLTDALDAFVEQAVQSGRYGNASEVVRDALRLLETKGRAAALALDGLREAGADDVGAPAEMLDDWLDRIAADAVSAALGACWDEGVASGPMRDGPDAMARLRERLRGDAGA